MSKDIENITREVIKNNKEIHRVDDKLSKELTSLDKEIQGVKKDIKVISTKIDTILDLLNTLIIVMEDAEDIISETDEDEEFEPNEGWLPEINNWEEHRDDEDE
jgi:chromosome segregation ATPase